MFFLYHGLGSSLADWLYTVLIHAGGNLLALSANDTGAFLMEGLNDTVRTVNMTVMANYTDEIEADTLGEKVMDWPTRAR